MARRAARLVLLMACVAAIAGEGHSGVVGGDVDATTADETARSLQASMPDWLAARSERQFRINGDTWHRISAEATAASANEAPPGEASSQQQGRGAATHYYYNERTRATAWQLPRHHARGTPLWAHKDGGGEHRLGPPVFDTSALSFPDCAADWATILLPAAIFAATKHAGATWRAVREAARVAAAALRGPSGAASKAD